MPKKFSLLILLTFLLALPILTTDIYLPSLYQMGEFFSANTQDVQLTLTLYFLTFGIVQLLYGSFSDCFGRKPMVIISLLVYLLATTMCIFASTIDMLIAGRIFQALGAGSAILVFAIIRDMHEGKEVAKLIAYMSGVVAISPIIAPIFGGYIQTYLSWQWNFIILGCVGLVLLIVSAKILPETNKYKDENQISFMRLFINYQSLIRNKTYMIHALSAAFAFGALFSYISGAPHIFLNLMGYSSDLFGWTFAVAAIGYVLGSFLSGRLTSQFGVTLVFFIGMVSLVGGSLIMLLLCQLFGLTALTVIIPQLVCEFGISIVIPISVTKALQPIPQYAGAGSALIGFMRFTLAAFSSFLTAEFQNSISLAVIICGFALCAWGCNGLQKIQYQRNPL
jgi:DHA1 family bicyclomycin/chloramphenicol resistance-like MFS transporter